MSFTAAVLENNSRYAASFESADLPAPPALKLAVVACMDARVVVHRILGLEEGDAHVIRNAGGIVTEDVIRSLLISQRMLGTEEIILIHHSGCGMQTFRDDEVKDQIEVETGVRPSFALGSFPDAALDVLESMARLKDSPFVPRKNGIRGFLYDLKSGLLSEVLPEAR